MERVKNPEHAASALVMQYRIHGTRANLPENPLCGSLILLTAPPVDGPELCVEGVGRVTVGIGLP